MKNNETSIGFRTKFMQKKKLQFISELEFRDTSGQMNLILDKWIKELELKHNLVNNDEYQEFLKFKGDLDAWRKQKE